MQLALNHDAIVQPNSMTTRMVLPDASDDALRDSVKSRRRAASSTSCRVDGRTLFMPRNARDTVASETPVAMATSWIVAMMSPFAVWWAVSDTVAVLAPPQSLRRTPMHINSIYVCAYILLYHDVRVVSGHGLIVFAMVYQCSVLCACDVTRNLQAAVDGV